MKCNICHKNNVPDEGEGARFFIRHGITYILKKEGIKVEGITTRQIRICEQCLKEDYSTIELD